MRKIYKSRQKSGVASKGINTSILRSIHTKGDDCVRKKRIENVLLEAASPMKITTLLCYIQTESVNMLFDYVRLPPHLVDQPSRKAHYMLGQRILISILYYALHDAIPSDYLQ
ncbi:hypothetical protein KIN20_034037 [Parelaphostrongylus tenuis]|uniref:Uncharacterized protein n=1 Tax=Parelaphostrongylus tenuis TaxID=148309 RepID=A0AAD5R9P3_PARTN|nr:hypothetical protein KIN20_034037 [Parelaphostrongylus tenuis]